MTTPARSARTALRPWLIVAIAAPLLAVGAWAAGLFDAPPPAPIVDRDLRELASITPEPRSRRPGRPPLVLFLGDSRYLKATRGASDGGFIAHPRPIDVDGHPLEILTYFTRAGANMADLDRFVDDILKWEPDAIVIEPELCVEETSFIGLVPPAFDETKRLQGWELRLSLWAQRAELPKPGRALPATRRFIERAEAAHIRVLVAQIPPSAALAKAVPTGYHAAIRALVCPLLERCDRDYLTFADAYPDAYFRDPLHLNTKGRDVFFPTLMRGVYRALAAPP